MKTCFGCCLLFVATTVTWAKEPFNPERELATQISQLRATNEDLRADVEIFHKGIVWARRYDQSLTPQDLELVNRAALRGLKRAAGVAANQTPWTTKTGSVLRGYISAVDRSTQPYGVVVPQSYDSARPMRLDVVLHGSSKPVGMSELRFGARFDDGDDGGKPAPEVDYIELHPLGR